MAETAETTVNEAGAAATQGTVPPADPTPAPQDSTPPAQPEPAAEAPQPQAEEPEGMGAEEEKEEPAKEHAEKKEGNDVLGAPEKGYDETGIELPEGIQLDEGAIEAFKKECKDLNLSQAAYSKLVTNMTSVLAKRAEEQSAQVKQALTAEAKADPQIGGANYAANLKSASRFYAKFFDAETRQFFESVGLNRHAGFIKGCLAAQQALSDDAVVKGGRSGELSTAERARAFFPNSKMN